MLAFSAVMALYESRRSVRLESPLNILGGKVGIWLPAVGHDNDMSVFCSQSCSNEASPLNMPVTVPSCANVGVGKDVSRLLWMFRMRRLESPSNMFAGRDAI